MGIRLKDFPAYSQVKRHPETRCPKNQKRCWYNTGSPPPAGSKNVVLKYRVKI